LAQGQGQGLDLQGQGLKICPRGHLKAKDNKTDYWTNGPLG